MRSLSGMRAERDDPEQLDLEGLVQVGAEEERRGGDGVAHHGGDALSPATAEKRSGVDAMIPALTVMARAGNSFDGERLRAALESQGLRHGRRSIFHHFDDAQPLGSPPRFSAANIVNPGTFDLSSMSEITTPGIALFLEIPGPVDPRDAFEQMLEVAQTLAVELDGNLCDDTRSTLTSQSVNHLREMIADFSRRQLLRV